MYVNCAIRSVLERTVTREKAVSGLTVCSARSHPCASSLTGTLTLRSTDRNTVVGIRYASP